MTQIESPKRKMQKKNDYQRHKLFRKIKRRRKAQAEAEQHIAEKQLRKKLKIPKFGGGKDIRIKESKRGTFTKAAKANSMSVQGFANKVLNNPGNYSAAMIKKANFARNAAKWNR